MAFVKADRVQEESTFTGTGNIILAGAYDASYRTFGSQMADGDTCQILTININAGSEWEVTEATYVAASNSLARNFVLSSSNANNTVDFTSGMKRVAMLPPASAMVVEDNAGNASIANNLTVNGSLAVDTISNSLTIEGNLTVDGSITANNTLQVVDNLAALKALTSRPTVVFMKGYATENDGGEGVWEWVGSSSATANDGTIVQCTAGPAGRYYRVVGDTIRPEWFGAKGDGSTSDSAAVLAAVNACNNQSILLNPNKTGYPFSVTVGSSSGCTGFLSIGGRARIVAPPGAAITTTVIYVLRGDFTVDNLFFDLTVSTNPASAPAIGYAMRCDLSGGSFVKFTNNHVNGGRGGIFFSTVAAVDCYVTGNKFENFWAEGVTAITSANVFITDNLLKDGGYSASNTSGAIRTSSPSGSYAENIIISRNIVKNCAVYSAQSTIDCYSPGAKNILISDNVSDLCGSGIELKTDGTGDATAGYTDISVSDNIIRLLPGSVGISGIALNRTTIADTYARNILVSNNQIFCDDFPLSDNLTYGITGNSYQNVTITSNLIYNVTRGVVMSTQYSTTAVLDRLVVSGNTITTSIYGIYSNYAGTVSNLRVSGNTVSSPAPALFTTATFSSPSITGNTFTSDSAIALRVGNVNGGDISNNILSGYTYGLYVAGTGTTGLLVSRNTIRTDATSGNDAVLVDASNSISLLENQIRVPTIRRGYSGSGTVSASRNTRGTTTTTPTTAAAVGDVWLNSAPANGSPSEWVCVTAGGSGAAVYSGTITGTIPVSSGGTGATTSGAASENLSTTYTVDNLAALKALTTRPSTVFMKGYATTSDGGEGMWEWVAGSTTTANDGTVVQCTSGTAGRYFRVVGDTIRPEWFGAKGDGTTIDSTAVLAAVNACNNQSVLLNPNKTGYPFAVTVPYASGCSGFISIGGKARVVRPSTATSGTNIIYSLRPNFRVDNLFFDLPIGTDPVVSPPVSKSFRWDGDGVAESNVWFTNNRIVGGGGGVSIVVGGQNLYVTDNIIEDTWSESIVVDVGQNAYIQRNVILRAGAYRTTGGSGAIRTSAGTGVMAENLIISDNIIKDSMWALSQSSIDCFTPSAKNILITGNILDYNGNGIELKTTAATPPATDTYRSHTISNNFIRPRSTGSGITLNSGSGPNATGKNYDVFITGNHISADTMASAADALYGIVLNLYLNLSVTNNTILNTARGIAFNPSVADINNMTGLVIEGNNIKVAGNGIYCSGTDTVTNAHFKNNDVESENPFQLRNATFNTVYVTDNQFISSSSYAVEIENVTNGTFARNTLIVNAANYGVRAVAGVVSADFRQNIVQTDATTGLDAFRIDAGCTVTLVGNQLTIPSTKQGYVGAGTVTAANNMRGTATATPTTAGAIGDTVLNSTPAAGSAWSWVCTTAGAAGVAVYTPVLMSSPGSASAATYLAAPVTMTTAATWYNGPNTGSIGANGQKWMIVASGVVVNTGGAVLGEVAIYDGTNFVEAQWNVGAGASWPSVSTAVYIVTLSAATTFTLKAVANANNSTLSAGNVYNTTLSPTYIYAVRLS